MHDIDSDDVLAYTSAMSTIPIHPLTAHEISHEIITAAMKVHSELGAGLLESAYQACLHHELREAGIRSVCQVGLPVIYHGVKLEIGYRMDLLVEDLVIGKSNLQTQFAPFTRPRSSPTLNLVAALSASSSTSTSST